MEQRILCQGYSTPNKQSNAPSKISIKFKFPANTSSSLHPIKLKLDLLLDHGMEHSILRLGGSTPNISYVPLEISVNFSFPAYSSYSLHPIKLKTL